MLGFLLFVGGLLAAVGRRRDPITQAGHRLGVERVIPVLGKSDVDKHPPIPKRIPKQQAPGIRIWGTGQDDYAATWRPTYLKSIGKRDLRWGVCIFDWVDDLQKCSDAPAWTRKIDDVIYWIANLVAAGAGEVAEWLNSHICVRFKWKGIRAYEWGGGDGTNWYAVDRTQSGILLNQSPDFPPNMPEVKGWKRVWVNTVDKGFAPMTRSDEAVQVFWPRQTEGGPVMQELLPRKLIRAMLRMDCKVVGSINSKQLARVATGRSSWWLARRSKAKEEYR